MRKKITLCYIALFASMLFLVIGVDYLPHLVCWMPMILTAFFVANCKAFFVHVVRMMERLIPLE